MIAKGFDFPEVTFVGVISVDSILNLPDFRADERVFQLLTQVAGRTGRGEKKGKVVVQTFNPDSAGIKYVKKYEIDKFYEEQLQLRKTVGYPPFKNLLQIIVQNEDEAKCVKEAERVFDVIEKTGIKNMNILGPAPAPLSRIRNKYRYSIILKSVSKKDLNRAGRAVKKLRKGSEIAVVVDPVSTL